MKLTVVRIGNSGSWTNKDGETGHGTELVFAPEQGEQLVWRTAWVDSSWVADNVLPGMVIEADSVNFGPVETTWTDKRTGETHKLKTPKQRVWLHGTLVSLPPENEPPVYTSTQQSRDHVAAQKAKKSS